MPAFRLIAEGRATLRELEDYYSIEDIADMNDVMDMMALQQDQSRRGG
ncbi:MAG: hypothetical protein GY926_19680 [bacterium]|nr:hypothetical protein [bacterium]